jgi:hypothetical protein
MFNPHSLLRRKAERGIDAQLFYTQAMKQITSNHSSEPQIRCKHQQTAQTSRRAPLFRCGAPQ